MSRLRELINDALRARFSELCDERVSHLRPETFGGMSWFVSRVREKLQSGAQIDIKNPGAKAIDDWVESDADCLAYLRALALGEELQLRVSSRPSLDSFMGALRSARNNPERRFQLLAERYACPLNFSHTAEDAAREYLLMRLMSKERALLERKGIEAVESEDLLLKLNLVSLHAASVSDLRFLDALNYYYELLPAGWQPRGELAWLLVSYFALYARAILARTSER
ncbi:MAG: hypothetical protein M3362_16725 [Acidobacteriota bacterium]|nr:hypothetical protein [Acidobacteriota bacterium]